MGTGDSLNQRPTSADVYRSRADWALAFFYIWIIIAEITSDVLVLMLVQRQPRGGGIAFSVSGHWDIERTPTNLGFVRLKLGATPFQRAKMRRGGSCHGR
jgi:hypothetical protein